MAKRHPIPEVPRETCPRCAVYIAPGETTYTIDIDEQTVESLERGICPEALANRMHALLSWRREALRVQAGRSFDAVTQGS